MRFAHLADCHVGSWSDKNMEDLNLKAFDMAMDKCSEVDFVLIAGDLFSTALPGIDLLKHVVGRFRELKDKGIPVYVVPGSHDYSPSGKSFIEVMEKAGLVENVYQKGLVEDKSGAKIAGILGRKMGLEKSIYKNIDGSELESAEGYKIFMFHSLVKEFLPDSLVNAESISLSMLPRNFDYYAGGHLHKKIIGKTSSGVIAYPGPTFPDSFKEIEENGHGGFIIVDEEVEYIPLEVCNFYSVKLDCEGKTPEQVTSELLAQVKDFSGTVVTIRLFGQLSVGKTTDVEMRKVFDRMYENGAICVLRNTSKLTSKEFERVEAQEGSVGEIENSIVKDHSENTNPEWVNNQQELIKKLMRLLDDERKQGERVSDFEKRIKKQGLEILTSS